MVAEHAGISAGMRIGELSRRTGVSEHVLRAWERRYALFAPRRTPSGYRMYGADDLHRVHLVQSLIRGGSTASEAARTVLAGATDELLAHAPLAASHATEFRRDVLAAIREYDEQTATATLDALAGEVGVEAALVGVVMPVLRDVGDGWQRGTTSIAHEHFASQLVRKQLARWAGPLVAHDEPTPAAVLACPPGEQHDLALLTLSVLLRRRRWSVHYLGPDTPVDQVLEVAATVTADVVVLAATVSGRFMAERAALSRARVPLVLAGAGATPELGRILGCEVTASDPLELAEALHGGRVPRPRR